MAALSSIKTPPPFSPSVTINTMEAVSAMVWVGPGILATTCSNGWSPASVELWDVAWHLEKIKKSGRFVYDDTNMHSPLRTISLANAPLSSMSAVNGLIIAGGSDGIVSVLDPSEKAAATGSCLQKFSDHKGAVTDIYAVSRCGNVSLMLGSIEMYQGLKLCQSVWAWSGWSLHPLYMSTILYDNGVARPFKCKNHNIPPHFYMENAILYFGSI